MKKNAQNLMQEKEKLEKQIPTINQKLAVNKKLVEADRLEREKSQ